MNESSRLNALQIMLKPLVRFMLAGAHSIQDFTEVLKKVYLDVAKEQIQKDGLTVNASRLVMATGIHRIEVNRLLMEEGPKPKPESNMLFRIIGLWQQGKAYRDKNGQPKILTYKGKNSQFARLLRSISLYLTPGTVQIELERIGAIEVTDKGLKLIADFERYNASENAAKFNLIATDVDLLISCIQENLSRPKQDRSPDEIGNLHLRTDYDNIYLERLPEIRAWLMQEGKEFHRRARDYLSQFDKDINEDSAEAGGRVVLHAFSLTTPGAEEIYSGTSEHLSQASETEKSRQNKD